ncbi:MAG: redoxin domain-containing protein [Gammaproteobacteria bacterium]|nr:redoxin domain-containing protein [Gammaproteobacteria bacterium]MCY4166393.1 redoxin domain-containing protein [Gammaproteobacteria bacterium]MCY4254843.1 redoxin domain-containing protein [Gammaproteobacteria bacterium]
MKKILAVCALAFAATACAADDLLVAGSVAPDWTLPGSDGSEHSLSDLRQDGAVVLAWFPKADTAGCTQECKSLTENGDKIRQFKVSYFMASVDSIEDNTAFAQKYSADFPILSDETKAVADAYKVLTAFGFARRHTFYIGTDGRILAVDREVNIETAAEDIVAMLEQLGVEKHGAAGASAAGR